jgi:APA family basic amino acid/polyamine antiporter
MADSTQLARKITLPLLLFYGLGNILGAGIYVLIGEVAGLAGLYAPFSFVLALVIASFTALSYSELAVRYPVSAGEAVYVREGLRSRTLSTVVGLTIALAGLVSAATIACGFAGYLTELLPLPEPAVIVGVVIILGAIAAWGIGESVAIASAITLVEIGGLLLILWVGAPAFIQLPERLPGLVPPMELESWHGIALGGFLAFYAFLGFEDMVNIAEEVKEPSRSFPAAILLALLIATLLYVGVSLVSILLLPPEQLSASHAPFATLYRHATGEDSTLITCISMLAVINGALIQIIMASRITYGMSRKGWLPAPLSYVHPLRKTPLLSTLLVTMVTIAFALWLPLVSLANLCSSLILIVFIMVNISLIRIKLRTPAPEGVHTVPFWVPVAATFLNLIFLAVQYLSS